MPDFRTVRRHLLDICPRFPVHFLVSPAQQTILWYLSLLSLRYQGLQASDLPPILVLLPSILCGMAPTAVTPHALMDCPPWRRHVHETQSPPRAA